LNKINMKGQIMLTKSGWRTLGRVTIDTGRLLLIDPIHVGGDWDMPVDSEFPLPWEKAVAVSTSTGMGDGLYTVQGRYCREWLAEIRIVFIDDEGCHTGIFATTDEDVPTGLRLRRRQGRGGRQSGLPADRSLLSRSGGRNSVQAPAGDFPPVRVPPRQLA
jgi:hypothetical protein